MNKSRIAFFALLLFPMLLLAQLNLKRVEANHSAFHFTGRMDHSNPDFVRFDWPGTSIECRFTGKEVAIHFRGGERNYFNLFINHQLVEVMHAPRDTVWRVGRLKGKGPHHLKITKRTEGGMGQTLFYGIGLEEKGEMLPMETIPTRRIEFVGNSITCGYGAEGADRTERFKPETENNYKSYGAILARAFGAEAHYIAHSGLGVVRNYGDKEKVSTQLMAMPGRYDRVMDMDSVLKWDFSLWKPHAVVVNLGTNDFSTFPHPDKVVFQRRYEALILKIREAHGNVPVFCMVGPMTQEPCFSYVKELVEGFRILHADPNVFFVGLPDGLLNSGKDLGSDSHPSYKGHKKIAGQLLQPMGTVLDWNPDATEIYE